MDVPYQDSAPQGWIRVPGEISEEIIRERQSAHLRPGFAQRNYVPFPINQPTSSSQASPYDVLAGEIAWVRRGGQAGSQGEPCIITTMNGEPVSRGSNTNASEKAMGKHAARELMKRYIPVGFVDHSVQKRRGDVVPGFDRPNIVVAGQMSVPNTGSTSISMWNFVTAEIPTPEQVTQAKLSPQTDRVTGVLRALQDSEVMPRSADVLAALRGADIDNDGLPAVLRDTAKVYMFLGAILTMNTDADTEKNDDEQLREICTNLKFLLEDKPIALREEWRLGKAEEEMAPWQWALRITTPGASALPRGLDVGLAKDIGAKRLIHNALETICATFEYTLNTISRRIMGFVTRPFVASTHAQPGYGTLCIRHGL